MPLFFRPQNIELGATGGASIATSSNMDDMTVEQMTIRANQVTDEVQTHPSVSQTHVGVSHFWGKYGNIQKF